MATSRDRTPSHAGGPEEGCSALLHRKLAEALGSSVRARAVVRACLLPLGREDVPDTPSEMMGFVKAYLVDVLTAELGPRKTILFVDEVAEAVLPGSTNRSTVRPRPVGRRPSSMPPAKRSSHERETAPPARPSTHPRPRRVSVPPRPVRVSLAQPVLVMDDDRYVRAELAKAFLRAGVRVVVCDNAEELERLHRSEGPFAAAVLDGDSRSHAESVGVLSVLAPGLAVVVRHLEPRRKAGRSQLAETTAPKSMTPSELVAAVLERTVPT